MTPHAALRGVSDAFIIEHQWHWLNADPQTVGALVHFRSGAYIRETLEFAPAEVSEGLVVPG